MAACNMSVDYNVDRQRAGYGSGRTFPGLTIHVEWDAGDAVSALELFDSAVKSVRGRIEAAAEYPRDEVERQYHALLDPTTTTERSRR